MKDQKDKHAPYPEHPTSPFALPPTQSRILEPYWLVCSARWVISFLLFTLVDETDGGGGKYTCR